MPAIDSFGSLLRRRLLRTGAVLCAGGAAALAWGAVCTPAGGVVLNARLASSGPPCGAGEACVKQSQVPTTAADFTTDCSVSAHPDEDLWHFTFPTPGSFSTDVTKFTAIFSNPSTQIHADSISGPGDKFAFVYSPSGATLQWAFATGASGGTEFNLSHTCPASQSSTTTTTSTATDPTTTTNTVSGTSTSTATDPGTVTSTSTATDPTTVTSTNTTTVTATGTGTASTTVTNTTAVLAGTSTTSLPAGGAAAATSTATESGAVAPLQASNPRSSGGAGGLAPLVDIPNTGAGNRTMAALTGLVLVLAGVACLGFAPRRTRTAQVER